MKNFYEFNYSSHWQDKEIIKSTKFETIKIVPFKSITNITLVKPLSNSNTVNYLQEDIAVTIRIDKYEYTLSSFSYCGAEYLPIEIINDFLKCYKKWLEKTGKTK